MNDAYLWWAVALALAIGGSIAFLALGQLPEIEDEPVAPLDEERPGAV